MSWYVCIIIGFVFIGIGVFGWLNSHIIEKQYVTKETHLVDKRGIVIQWNVTEALFEKYEIKRKEPIPIDKNE